MAGVAPASWNLTYVRMASENAAGAAFPSVFAGGSPGLASKATPAMAAKAPGLGLALEFAVVAHNPTISHAASESESTLESASALASSYAEGKVSVRHRKRNGVEVDQVVGEGAATAQAATEGAPAGSYSRGERWVAQKPATCLKKPSVSPATGQGHATALGAASAAEATPQGLVPASGRVTGETVGGDCGDDCEEGRSRESELRERLTRCKAGSQSRPPGAPTPHPHARAPSA